MISDNPTDKQLLAKLIGAVAAEKLVEQYGDLQSIAMSHADALPVSKQQGNLVACAIELGRRSMGPAQPKPKLSHAPDVSDYYTPKLGHLDHEVFHVACLNVRNRLLLDAKVAQGGFSSCAILPREVFAPAIRVSAVGVILVHNHPSGEFEPSSEDLMLTNRLRQAGEVLGIRVLDHVIITRSGYLSLAEAGRFAP